MIAERRSSRSPIAFLAVVVLIVLGIGFLAWRQLHDASDDATTANTANVTTQSSSNTNETNENTNTAEAQLTFEDPDLGFSIAYPEAWKRTRSTSGDGEAQIINYVFGSSSSGVTLIVVPKDMEGIVRESFSVTDETPVTINGQSASRVSGTTAKEGAPLTLLFFQKNDTVFVLNGPEEFVDSVGSTFKFLE